MATRSRHAVLSSANDDDDDDDDDDEAKGTELKPEMASCGYGSDTGRPTRPTTQAGNSAFNTRRDFWYKTKE
uniref:Uncharacterized protein n=1 Tax=Vespula pensylvanica TaxID=30213 RepID=A0A834UH01_VESPE|nr:hypothetical protein H0235_001023 [Vespula pensylvanica]